MTGFEWTMIGAAVAILAFLWRLSEKVSAVETRLGERIARIEGLLEGMGRPPPSLLHRGIPTGGPEDPAP